MAIVRKSLANFSLGDLYPKFALSADNGDFFENSIYIQVLNFKSFAT